MDWFKNKKNIYIIAGICLIIVCIIVCIKIESDSKSEGNFSMEEKNIEEKNMVTQKESEPEIIVHITGEINNPGIIKIKEGSRLVDVIEKAGGYTDKADTGKINLAYVVKDEQKIVIPNIDKKDEEIYVIDENKDFIVNDTNDSGGLVNINTATQSELESLTGIGPSMASKILDYRDKNGKFKTKEDIKNVPGIGNSKYEAIKDEICVK